MGYLTVDRTTRTLSGGETARVNLTTCLGTRLVNTLYVLDEPSVGLHPRDSQRLIRVLQTLRDAGNTVVVVEHEPEVMRAADLIVDIGPGVTAVQRGERVTAPHFTLWTDGDYDPAIFAADAGNTRDGWLAERIVLPASSLVRIPESLSFESAAALGAAGITAWAVLETLGRIKAGDTVLTLGTGGVAILTLQIAKMCGARVAITSSSDDKLALCRKLGADITVNYRKQPAWHEAVRAANGGRGVDIVVETVGASSLSQSLAACAPNARVGLLGALGGPAPAPPNLGPLILNNVILKGITSGSRRNLEDLLRASVANGLTPHIDRVFAFDESAQALSYLATGEHVGKIVIRRS